MNQKGDKPNGRSGHTLNWIGGFNYLLYGGIEDAKNGKIKPNGDLYMMKLAASKFKFYLILNKNQTSLII